MPTNHFIGRKVSVGLGFETTPGTAVAPSTWIRTTNPDFHDQPTFIENNSALGRVEDSDDQALVKQLASGKLEGDMSDLSIGYLLANIFGTWASAAHPSETTVYDTTFTTSQSNTPPTLTIVKKDGVENKRYALGTIADVEFACTAGAWATFSASAMAKLGVAGTDTPAYVAENNWTSKHISIKLANNIAGLTGATPIQAVSFKLKIDRKPSDFTPLGAIDPVVFDTTAWVVTGEMVLRYDAATYHDLTFNNTQQALQISLINSDKTIGTASNPTLTFTAPKARLNTWSVNSNLDQAIDQTVGFKCNLDTTAGYMLQALLTNTKSTYA